MMTDKDFDEMERIAEEDKILAQSILLKWSIVAVVLLSAALIFSLISCAPKTTIIKMVDGYPQATDNCASDGCLSQFDPEFILFSEEANNYIDDNGHKMNVKLEVVR